MNDYLYVVGHKNPDSDSICSALAYANLKNKCGEKASACRLGPLNEESKYILKRFGFENPLLLKDARSQLRDIDMDTPNLINEKATLNEAWNKMLTTNNRSLFVLNDDNQLVGILSTSNLSLVRLLSDEDLYNLMKTAKIEDIAKTIKGQIELAPKHFSSNGRVYIVTLNRSEDFQDDFKGSICVLSDGDDKQKLLIEKGAKCLIITCNRSVTRNIRHLADINECAIITTKLDTMKVARIVNESFCIKKIITTNVISFNENEYVEDVAAKMMKSRVRSYPVLDYDGNVIGAISRYHLQNYRKKRFILVDHSAKNQAINNIDKALVEEIIDHHHIGNIETDYPIFYRNQKCGCTATIISMLYQENGLLPDDKYSGLLLSAIISDTLNFKSATTTQLDINTAYWLAQRANIDDIGEYAKEMLGASVSLKDAKPIEILNRDLKNYDVGKYRMAIGQTNYNRLEQVQGLLPEFKKVIEKQQQDSKLDLMVMMFTHVLAEGTLFVFYGPLSYVMADVIETRFDEHSGYDKDIISRKQQLMPKLSAMLKSI